MKANKKPKKSKLDRAWARLRATFAEPADFDHKFPGPQPRQILISAKLGRL